jgi:hypothetical protein
MVLEYFEKKVAKLSDRHIRCNPIEDICLMVIRVQIWFKMVRTIELISVLRFLILVYVLDPKGMDAVWLWRQVVSEENNIKRNDDFDWSSRKVLRYARYLCSNCEDEEDFYGTTHGVDEEVR